MYQFEAGTGSAGFARGFLARTADDQPTLGFDVEGFEGAALGGVPVVPHHRHCFTEPVFRGAELRVFATAG